MNLITVIAINSLVNFSRHAIIEYASEGEPFVHLWQFAEIQVETLALIRHVLLFAAPSQKS